MEDVSSFGVGLANAAESARARRRRRPRGDARRSIGQVRGSLLFGSATSNKFTLLLKFLHSISGIKEAGITAVCKVFKAFLACSGSVCKVL